LKTHIARESHHESQFFRILLDRIRSQEGSSVLRGKRVAMHLLIQPVVATAVFGDELLIGQGVLSRILSVMPDPAAGSRPFIEPTEKEISSISRFSRSLRFILETRSNLRDERGDELEPRVLRLSEQAQSTWIAYYEGIESQLKPDTRLYPVKALANKAPEHAARLAATLEGFQNPNIQQISDAILQCCTKIVDFYLGEALRIYATIEDSADLKLAERTLSWLRQWHEKEEAFSLRDMYQFGPYAISTAETAKRILTILLGHGCVIPAARPVTVKGTKRREAYTLSPLDENAQNNFRSPANPTNSANEYTEEAENGAANSAHAVDTGAGSDDESVKTPVNTANLGEGDSDDLGPDDELIEPATSANDQRASDTHASDAKTSEATAPPR
jgi:Protein of unknown function (DUF3987)